jgi:hypothetical protein
MGHCVCEARFRGEQITAANAESGAVAVRSGRNKPAKARGHVKRVFCESSGALVPKDKGVVPSLLLCGA